MAFIERYRAECQQARDLGRPVKWTPSLGHDRNGRDGPLLAAVAERKLLAEHVLPHLIGESARDDLLRVASPESRRLIVEQEGNRLPAPDPQKKAALDALVRDFSSDVGMQP
jgi:hypothetical protein